MKNITRTQIVYLLLAICAMAVPLIGGCGNSSTDPNSQMSAAERQKKSDEALRQGQEESRRRAQEEAAAKAAQR